MVKQWLLSTLQTNNNNYININNGSNKVKMYKLKTMIMSAGSLFSQNVHMPLLTNCSHASSSIETGAFVPACWASDNRQKLFDDLCNMRIPDENADLLTPFDDTVDPSGLRRYPFQVAIQHGDWLYNSRVILPSVMESSEHENKFALMTDVRGWGIIEYAIVFQPELLPEIFLTGHDLSMLLDFYWRLRVVYLTFRDITTAMSVFNAFYRYDRFFVYTMLSGFHDTLNADSSFLIEGNFEALVETVHSVSKDDEPSFYDGNPRLSLLGRALSYSVQHGNDNAVSSILSFVYRNLVDQNGNEEDIRRGVMKAFCGRHNDSQSKDLMAKLVKCTLAIASEDIYAQLTSQLLNWISSKDIITEFYRLQEPHNYEEYFGNMIKTAYLIKYGSKIQDFNSEIADFRKKNSPKWLVYQAIVRDYDALAPIANNIIVDSITVFDVAFAYRDHSDLEKLKRFLEQVDSANCAQRLRQLILKLQRIACPYRKIQVLKTILALEDYGSPTELLQFFIQNRDDAYFYEVLYLASIVIESTTEESEKPGYRFPSEASDFILGSYMSNREDKLFDGSVLKLFTDLCQFNRRATWVSRENYIRLLRCLKAYKVNFPTMKAVDCLVCLPALRDSLHEALWLSDWEFDDEIKEELKELIKVSESYHFFLNVRKPGKKDAEKEEMEASA